MMRQLGLNGIAQGSKQQITIRAKDGVRAGDQPNRDFTADAPNLAWAADFTYVSTWTGWAYAAYAFDVYSLPPWAGPPRVQR
ncbi:MAG TPA: hypothetical protein VFG87_24735 [Amycolatopsis sp.]|nr:hypothetical protein [Amycolatopsis sp.]